jgi:hypothetical protein
MCVRITGIMQTAASGRARLAAGRLQQQETINDCSLIYRYDEIPLRQPEPGPARPGSGLPFGASSFRN